MRELDRGPTAERTAANVRAVREARGLTLAELSARLRDVGRPILASGLGKVEQGDRRVDVDDLVALAVALGVTPNRLLLPDSYAEDDSVGLTPRVARSSEAVWDWAEGRAALSGQSGVEIDLALTGKAVWSAIAAQEADYQRNARPKALHVVEDSALMRAAHAVASAAKELFGLSSPSALDDEQTAAVRTHVRSARRSIAKLKIELDEIEESING